MTEADLTPKPIYNSAYDMDTNVSGYEVMVAFDPSGGMHSLAIMDHERGDLVEMPIDMALRIAAIIQEQVRLPGSTIN